MRPSRLLLAALLIGCQAAEEEAPPAVPPPFEAQLHLYAGTLLEGRLPLGKFDISPDPAEALGVRFEAYYLEAPRPGGFDDLALVGEYTRLIISTPATSILLAAGLLTSEARVATGERASELLAELRGTSGSAGNGARFDSALPRGVTAYLFVRLMGSATAGGLESLVLHASRPGPGTGAGESLELAVQVNGDARVWRRISIAQMQPGQASFVSENEFRYEAAVLGEMGDTASSPIVVIIPTAVRADSPAEALVLALEVSRPPRVGSPEWSSHAERVATAVGEVGRQADESAEAGLALMEPQARTAALISASDALFSAETVRATFAYLGQVVRSPLVADLALVGDDDLLMSIAERARAEEVQRVDGAELLARSGFGWTLERSAVLELSAELRASELDQETTSLLALHVGELALYPGLLERAVLASDDSDGFQRQLVLLNREFLADLDPAARVTAYDWLLRQGTDVPGYDPLGSYAERQRVLAEDRARVTP